MKLRVILLFCLVALVGMPDVSAQSFKKKLKKAVKKVEQTVSTPKKKISKKSSSSSIESTVNSMVGANNNRNMEDEAPTVRLPESHTALFAPLGYEAEASLGTKTYTPEKPPRDETKQPDWNYSRISPQLLNNKSLVDEYLLLYDCVNGENAYITAFSPSYFRFRNVKEELFDRLDALNGLAGLYYEALAEYNADPFYNWVVNGIHRRIATILETDVYEYMLRSSLAPLFQLEENRSPDEGRYLEEKTLKYFKTYGGYKNAHKANWTVWNPEPDRATVSTSSDGQTGTLVTSKVDGAIVDIEGITYILHNGKGNPYVYVSEVVKTAVANKDIVIPDYVTFNNKKYPVKTMRGEIFRGTAIKSVKLPSTLTEISNGAFRGTPITEIVIPASVKKIEGSAFFGCKNLKSVVFESDDLPEIQGCFQQCTSLKTIKFPRRVGNMSYSMFEGCVNLTNVTLPENITEIYEKMFYGCTNLKTLDVPSSVTKIGSGAFDNSGITSLNLSNVTEFTLFYGCKSLKTVRLNSKLKENFVENTYIHFMHCPLLQVKYVNNNYVIPDGFIFGDGK